ncbi:uncharacterized protein AB675_1614 [Cyphellophora attinorum]|uniref:Transcription factor domain-containing protein n=1 Tax=Cyphellophora attinorum TaxID=1664694 RepID=A0A0N0NIQ4_9EURO|nr:uncharacterized protein AB675_1614 [Phialophora attinorum]KPI36091.1 hypothetical protein AB675_1614 [Phialophora attinorum]
MAAGVGFQSPSMISEHAEKIIAAPWAPPRKEMKLLFVVRSGNSSIKTQESQWQINRHAQRNAQSRKEARHRRPLPARPAMERVLHVLKPEAEEKAEDAPKPLSTKQLALTQPTENVDDVHATSLRNVLDCRRLDPFSSGRTPMTPHMESIFVHFANVLLPVIEPIQSERDDFHKWLVPATMAEPALLYALTACFAYDIEMGSAYGFGPTARKSWTTERVMYRIKAIQALNECLADETNA